MHPQCILFSFYFMCLESLSLKMLQPVLIVMEDTHGYDTLKSSHERYWVPKLALHKNLSLAIHTYHLMVCPCLPCSR